jgi:peptidase A4-like protein
VASSPSSKGDETLYQTGTGSDCLNGVPDYVAFVEDEGVPNQFATDLGGALIDAGLVILGCPSRLVCSTALSVEPGDSITASVVDKSVYTRWTITDTRQGIKLWSHTKFWLTHAHRHSAECIVEDPVVGSKTPSIGTLANFGTVTFSNCQASDTTGKLWRVEGRSLPTGWKTIDYSIQQQGWIVACPSGFDLSVTWLGPKTVIPPFPNGVPSSVVNTPNGVEAATWDQSGNIDFWKLINAVWVSQGTSTYPVLPGDEIDTSVTGALLTHMSDAVFIAQGVFTGDGSGSAIAFTNGVHGWGTIAGPTGQPMQATGHRSTDNTTPGLQLRMSFRNGYLSIAYHNYDFATSDGTLFDLNIDWLWNGFEFVDSRDNIFTARKAATPNTHQALRLPFHTCPTPPGNGSYLSYWGVGEGMNTVDITIAQNDSLEGAGVGQCTFDVNLNVPLTIQATSKVGGTREWITAPIWILFDLSDTIGTVEEILSPGLAQFPSMYRLKGGSPFYVPAALDLKGLAPLTGNQAIAVLRNGKLVGLTVLPA